MSGSLNKVMLIGHTGKDPETRYMPNGNPVCNVSIATSENWKDKNTGEKKERTEWHNITFFGRLAEIVAEYVTKGMKIYVEGSIRTEKYEKDGQTRYATKIMGQTMKMLSSKGDSAPRSDSAPRPAQTDKQKAPVGQQYDDSFDDDIPF